VAQGELTGIFNIVEKHCFGYTIVSDQDGQYIIKQ